MMADKNKELIETMITTIAEAVAKNKKELVEAFADRMDRGLQELRVEIVKPALTFTNDEPPKGFTDYDLREELRNLLSVPKHHKIKLFVGDNDFTAIALSTNTDTPVSVFGRIRALATTTPIGSASEKNLDETAVQVEIVPTLKPRLQGFVDASATNAHFPFFIVKSDGFWLSSNPDGACTDMCMFIEFKLKDGGQVDVALRKVLERLRGVMSMNAFLLRAVGFATDGSEAYQARNHRSRVPRANTVLIAHALKEAFGDAPTIGYVKVDLHDHSSSRVWIVYGAEELQNGDQNNLSLRASFNNPLFVVKVNRDGSGRYANEFNALSRLAHSPQFVLRGTNEDAKQLAHYKTFHDEHPLIANALVEHFPVLFAIKLAGNDEEIDSVHFNKKTNDAVIPEAVRTCLGRYTTKNSLSACWADFTSPSSHLHKKLGEGGGSAVVMRIGLPLDFVQTVRSPETRELIINAVARWEWLYMSAGIFHSDVRPPNVLWFPRISIDDALKCVAIPPPDNEKAMTEVEKAMGALSVSSSDYTQRARAGLAELRSRSVPPESSVLLR